MRDAWHENVLSTRMCSNRECVLTGRGIVSGSASLQQRARSLARERARRKGRRGRRWCAHARTGGGRKGYEIDSRRGGRSGKKNAGNKTKKTH